LLANVYLHRLDRAWRGAYGRLVRFADDLVVMCRSQGQAQAALARLRVLLAGLGLEPKAAKTRVVHLQEGGPGFDFLGFHHRWVRPPVARGGRRVAFLARWPSRKAAQHARDRIREITGRSRLRVPVDYIVREINTFVRGWAGYFRYGNSTHTFDKITAYAEERMCLFVGKRHKRGRRYGSRATLIASGHRLGLINLHGVVVAPRPNRAWRVTPNTAGEGRR